MAFTQVQFLGFTLNTSYATADSGKSHYPGITVGTEIGTDPRTKRTLDTKAKADEQDLTSRLALLRYAIQRAERRAVKSGSSTLKLFVAPEFFFRPRYGAYPMALLETAIDRLQALALQEKYREWIFVFGSLIGFSEGSAGKKTIYNLVLVQRGGFIPPLLADHRAGYSRLVMKEYVAGDGGDYIKAARAATPDLLTEEAVEAVARGDATTELQENADRGTLHDLEKRGALFDLNGIRFALEICADHQNGRLRKRGFANGVVKPHLVVSCGADIAKGSVVAQTNGWVFHVDGRQVANMETPVPHLRKVTAESYDADPSSNGNNANLAPEVVPEWTENLNPGVDVDNPSYTVEKYGRIDVIFPKGPGKLSGYAPVAIPAAAKTTRAYPAYLARQQRR